MLNSNLIRACKDKASQSKLNNLDRSYFASPEWYQAMTLTERIESLPTAQNKRHNNKAKTDLSQQRMKRWKSQYPFTNDKYLLNVWH